MTDNEPTPARASRRPLWQRLLIGGLPILVLAGAVVMAIVIMSSKPTAQRNTSPAESQARLVTVTLAEAAPQTLMISANGTVEAAQSTALRARVSGQIVALDDSLAPGTEFDKNDVLARIDDSDYQIALTEAKTQLANAKAALDTENGQQAVAQRELELVGSDNVSQNERNLALRGPQLAQAKADVESAQSQVDQARLDLSRTKVKAPFNGIVTSRDASIGNVVTSSDTLATLAATDNYWVDLSLPVDLLRWIRATEGSKAQGTPARVYYPDAWGKNAYLNARVLRIQAQLEEQGRLARVLLRVPHPMGTSTSQGHRLLLGAYVSAKLEARMPANSVVIDSSFVRENNQVWVMSDDNTLDIRKVDVAYQDATQAVVSSGLAAGDEVITSDLSAPIQNMPIRVEASATAAKDHEADNPTQAGDQPTRGDQAKQRRTSQSQSIAAQLELAPAYTRLTAPSAATEQRS